MWVPRNGRAGVRRLRGVSPEERIVELEALVARQAALIEAQAETIARLEARIVELETQVGRNSGNSSLPPSRDGRDRRVRRADEREQRKQARRDGAGGTGRAPGKQPGAPGMTMRRREPDITIVHRPVACGRCTADLTDATVIGSDRRTDPCPLPSGHCRCVRDHPGRPATPEEAVLEMGQPTRPRRLQPRSNSGEPPRTVKPKRSCSDRIFMNTNQPPRTPRSRFLNRSLADCRASADPVVLIDVVRNSQNNSQIAANVFRSVIYQGFRGSGRIPVHLRQSVQRRAVQCQAVLGR